MELLASIAIVVVLALVLWERIDNLAIRQGLIDARAVRLQEDLGHLQHEQGQAERQLRALQGRLDGVQGEVAALVAAAASAPTTPVPAAQVAAPGSAPVAAGSAPVAASRPVAAAAPPSPPARARHDPLRAASARSVIADALRPTALAADATTPAGTASEPGPRPGPGLIQRLVRQLGFAPAGPGERGSRLALEAWLEGRLLAVVGGIALLLGAAFFLSLAFSRGWITEPMRVLIGLIAGAGLLVLGEIAFSKLRGIVGHVLVAVGLAIVSLALFAATRLYDIGVPVELGLLGAFVAAVATAVIAIRHDSQLVAAFGLVAVLAAPPVLGASATFVTLLFVAAALVGTTAIALFRTWTWLPPLAFVLAGPQVAAYVAGGPPLEAGLVAIAGFWLVNAFAAGGEETRHATDRLRSATVTLLLASAAFTLWTGFTILGGSLEPWRGAFLAAMAAAHLALALTFLVRLDDRHPFGLVVAATGVAALTMAVPIQFGGPPVPIAWAAEGVALAWIAVVRRHPYSAGVAAILGTLALGHLVLIEYSPRGLVAGFDRAIPFVGPEGMTFAFVVAALAVTGLIVRIAWIRAGLAVVGGLVAIYVFPFELSGPALVAGWMTLATAGLVLSVRVVGPRLAAASSETGVQALGLPKSLVAPVAEVVSSLRRLVHPAFLATAAVAGVGAIAHLGWFDYPAWMVLAGTPHDTPFVGLPGLSFAIVLAAIACAAALTPIASARIGLAAFGGLVAAYVLPFELSGPALVAGWAALATAAFVIESRVIEGRVGQAVDGSHVAHLLRPAVRAVGALTGFAVLVHLVALDFPIDQLGRQILSPFPYAGPEGVSLAAALAALGAVGLVMGQRWIRLGLAGIGGALLACTVTFEVGAPHVTLAWGALVLASLAVVRRVANVEPLPRDRRPSLETVGERLPFASAGLALLFLVARALIDASPAHFFGHLAGRLSLDGVPFVDPPTYVLAVLAATVLLAGWTWRGVMPRLLGAIAAALAVAWLLPFEVRPGYAVAGWSALALAGLGAVRIVPGARRLLGAASIAMLSFGALVALAVVAPIDRLVVDQRTLVAGWPLLTDATVALGALAVAVGAGALLHRNERLFVPALVTAGVVAVYLLSIAVADQFQLQVGIRPLEELQKGAQVGLSVLWSLLGTAGFAIGLGTHRSPIRLFGLGLLGLATVKVFMVDLAALDVAYRVLSLVALGVLLLLSAAVYSRVQHPHGPGAPGRGDRPAPARPARRRWPAHGRARSCGASAVARLTVMARSAR